MIPQGITYKRPPTKLKLGKPQRGRNPGEKNSQLPCEGKKMRKENWYCSQTAEQGKKVLDETKTKQGYDKSGSQRDGPLRALTGDWVKGKQWPQGTDWLAPLHPFPLWLVLADSETSRSRKRSNKNKAFSRGATSEGWAAFIHFKSSFHRRIQTFVRTLPPPFW